LNLSGREVPYGFIEKAVQNGCEYLNLGYGLVLGGKKSEVPWKLKYLEMSQSELYDYDLNPEVPEGVLQNCHFLQKLALDYVALNSCEIEQICQNGETLNILSLEGCNIDFDHRTELVQKLFSKCPQLTELNLNKGVGVSPILGNSILDDSQICALVDNLTPNILKLNLGIQPHIRDEHVNSLVQRCNKITELDLSRTSITNDSIESIIKHLNSLEKLDLNFTDIDLSKILLLRSIPTLKVLHCFHGPVNTEKIKNLKLKLPHISVNEDYLHIASSKKEVSGSIDPDWFWEIRGKQQDSFPKYIHLIINFIEHL
jgi:hypothetical protein